MGMIARKELADILRDRRTLVAMVLVPIVLYPALMLGSLQALEAQTSRLKQETYTVAVPDAETQRWLRRALDTDPARRAPGPGVAGEDVEATAGEAPPAAARGGGLGVGDEADGARQGVRQSPPDYVIRVVSDVAGAVREGGAHVGLIVHGALPEASSNDATALGLVVDQTEVRSTIAAAGLDGVLQRLNQQLVLMRLARLRVDADFLTPLRIEEPLSVETPEKRGGSILGQIVPFILIIMTITGAVYPAIDLTAGERERGTLETLMVAPVPTVDLIAGKFMVVAFIGMLSAFLNLLSIGGTIYLSGVSDLLSRGNAVRIPLEALPLVLVVLLPMAVMFSALLLAVCSFARSFKEAQNYVMPVMVAAMIPGVVGVLPGVRLEGPLLITPVANIVVLTRDLFMGRFDVEAILWVMLSTTIYAGAAVAVAAKLFGQEAVLFADSGSLRTIFQRRFFKPAARPSAAQALLLLALVYPLNFFVQRAVLQNPALTTGGAFLWALAAILIVLFVFLPMCAAQYMRVRVETAFALRVPTAAALLAALCFGLSTWILVQQWLLYQQQFLPVNEDLQRAGAAIAELLQTVPPVLVILAMAVVPGVAEELFFRGYALSGLRGAIGRVAAVFVVALAFAVYHHSIHRMFVTLALGLVLGALVIRGGSIWPAIVAHVMHNALLVAASTVRPLQEFLARQGFVTTDDGGAAAAAVPTPWLIGAAILFGAGMVLLLVSSPRAAPEALPVDPLAAGPVTAPGAVSELASAAARPEPRS
ncbi:MAG: ABC transporter permease subunit/CPBP intramembrane protease [Phycisphaerae bacterium]